MLTEKQRKTYEFIQNYWVVHGLAPTIAEIAKALGIQSRGVVHRYVKALAELKFIELLPGRRRNIQLLQHDQLDIPLTDISMPILGRIAAGKPIEAINTQAYLNISDTLLGAQRYLLEVKGDSMIGDNICDGDFIICEQRQTAMNGDIVVALVRRQEATLKRIYYQSDGTVRLVPSNPSLKPMVYRADEVIIQGIYRGLLRIRRHA